MSAIMVRFEDGGRTVEFGPYPYAQLTFSDLTVGPDGDTLASYDLEDDVWTLHDGYGDTFTDAVIYPVDA